MIPAYDLALHVFETLVVDGMIGVDPVLGHISSRATVHAGPIRNVPGSNPVDHDLTTFQGSYVIHADKIRETDVEEFITAICGLAETYEEAMSSTFIRTMTDVSDAVGNSIDAKGQPFSWDIFLDGLEKIEFAFDDDGKHSPLQILVNPETYRLIKSIGMTPEQSERYNDVMKRKKEAWHAQQRTRRLPRRNQ